MHQYTSCNMGTCICISVQLHTVVWLCRNFQIVTSSPSWRNFRPENSASNVCTLNSVCEEVRIFLLHLILPLPSEFWPALRVPPNSHNRDLTVPSSFDLTVHNFDWFFNKTELLVHLDMQEFRQQDISSSSTHEKRYELPRVQQAIPACRQPCLFSQWLRKVQCIED